MQLSKQITSILFSVTLSACGASHTQSSRLETTPPLLVQQLVETPGDFSTAITIAGGSVFASSVHEKSIRVYNAATAEFTGNVKVGNGPYRLVSDDDRVYVVNQWAREEGDVYLSVVDAKTKKVVRTLEVSEKQVGDDPMNYPWTNFPQDVAVQKDQLFVSFPTNSEPNIMTIDRKSWQEKKFIPAGHGPWRLTASKNSLIIVNELNMFDPSQNEVIETDFLGNVLSTHKTPGHFGQVIMANGKAWIAQSSPERDTGAILIIDPVTHEMRKIAVGRGPEGLAFAGERIYVACSSERRIDVIDVNSELVVETIDLSKTDPVIESPRGLAVTASGMIFLRSMDPESNRNLGKIFVLKRD